MRSVSIVGIGQTAVREHWEMGVRDLAGQAVLSAMDEADISTADALFVGNMLSGALSQQEHLGALIAGHIGLNGIEAVKVEAACGSGAAAFRQALLAIASGYIDTAIVVGVEKLTEMSGAATTHGLATAADADYEASIGLTFVAINALMMQRYLYEYGYSKDDFAPFAINAHHNASHNPNAMFRKAVTTQQYRKAKMIADPINLLDSSPIADGAAAIILTASDSAHQHPGQAIQVLACESATDTIALDNRKDVLWLKAVEQSVAKAFNRSGCQHQDIDIFELHDAFSIISALSLEASGFAERGHALRFSENEAISTKGRLPISTMGGLKGRGHPVGATGVYQIIELAQQLRCKAPEAIQVQGAKCGMAQNIGGSGATVITTILSRDA